MTNWAQRERVALVSALREAGPHAPTLCHGWTTNDLAAHVVIRERRIDAAGGIIIPALGGYTDSIQRKMASRPYGELLSLIASGPPLWSPLRAMDRAANVLEMFVHCEDVRRAQPRWEPRDLPEQFVSSLWRRLSLGAKFMWRRCEAPLVLVSPLGSVIAKAGSPAATVAGQVGELVMLTFGRHAVHVEWDGDDSIVNSARGTNLRV